MIKPKEYLRKHCTTAIDAFNEKVFICISIRRASKAVNMETKRIVSIIDSYYEELDPKVYGEIMKKIYGGR